MRWTVAVGLLPTFAFFALAGCGGEDESPPSERLAEFRVEGGIAGFDDELTVNRDGRVTSNQGCPLILSADELDRLKDALTATDFASLDSEYDSEDVADELTYRVKYENHTVKADSTAAPQELGSVLAELSRIHADCLG